MSTSAVSARYRRRARAAAAKHRGPERNAVPLSQPENVNTSLALIDSPRDTEEVAPALLIASDGSDATTSYTTSRDLTRVVLLVVPLTTRVAPRCAGGHTVTWRSER